MNPQTVRVTFASDCDTDTVGGLVHRWHVTVFDFLGAKVAEGEVDADETDDEGLFLNTHPENVKIPWCDVANIEIV